MTLSTSSLDGKPHSTPLFYANDEKFNFYWYSKKETKHSLLIKDNNKVSISIFGVGDKDEGFGVYLEGIASEIPENELSNALEIYFNKALKDNQTEREEMISNANDFLNESPLRMYKFIPEKIYVSGEATKWNGKWLDFKSEIELL